MFDKLINECATMIRSIKQDQIDQISTDFKVGITSHKQEIPIRELNVN